MTAVPPAAPLATPCVGICAMDGNFCRGCQRTLAEIALWSRLGAAERQRIMQEILPARKSGQAGAVP